MSPRDVTTTCSTWHVRVDLVEDEGHLRGRAKFVGAPAAMIPIGGERPVVTQDVEHRLASWRPLDKLAEILTEALSVQHKGPRAPEERTA